MGYKLPLISQLSYRAITNAGFNLHEKVVDVVSNGARPWRVSWFDNFRVLINVPTPILNGEHVDALQWKMRDGTFRLFSVRDVLDSIREQGNAVEWFQLVCSRYSIPRHATHLWLVMRNRLKTHDRMRQWCNTPNFVIRNGIQIGCYSTAQQL